jgi:hypothetical protein
MNGWVITLAALIFTVIVAIIGWIGMAWNRSEKKAKQDTVFADTLKNHQENFDEIDDRLDDGERRFREHDNFWRATELRMTEFTQIQKDMVALKSDFKEVTKKMEDADEKRDRQDEKMAEKFEVIKDSIHQIHLALAKLAK